MRTFVLTRSAYGPAWSLDANQRRLDVTRAVTARLMRLQTCRDWTWVVLLDRRDALLEERRAVFAGAAPAFEAIEWEPPRNPAAAPWDRHGAETNTVQRIAAEAYRAPWRDVVGHRDEAVMQIRLDDDDGLAVDALDRYARAAEAVKRRTVLMLPNGVRVWRGRYSKVRHEQNAMHALVTPPGDGLSVYDYGHTKVRRAAPVVMVDEAWGWLWVRHQDTISGWKRAERRIDPPVRDAFPVDWKALARAWT